MQPVTEMPAGAASPLHGAARQQTRREVPDDACPGCGGQLGVIRGPVMMPRPGVNDGSSVPETDARGQPTPRARRQSAVACSRCGVPVAIDHPRQVKLDAEWDVLEAKQAAEKRRAETALPPALPPLVELNPVAFVSGELDKALARIAALEAGKRDMEARVAILEKLAEEGEPEAELAASAGNKHRRR